MNVCAGHAFPSSKLICYALADNWVCAASTRVYCLGSYIFAVILSGFFSQRKLLVSGCIVKELFLYFLSAVGILHEKNDKQIIIKSDNNQAHSVSVCIK